MRWVCNPGKLSLKWESFNACPSPRHLLQALPPQALKTDVHSFHVLMAVLTMFADIKIADIALSHEYDYIYIHMKYGHWKTTFIWGPVTFQGLCQTSAVNILVVVALNVSSWFLRLSAYHSDARQLLDFLALHCFTCDNALRGIDQPAKSRKTCMLWCWCIRLHLSNGINGRKGQCKIACIKKSQALTANLLSY